MSSIGLLLVLCLKVCGMGMKKVNIPLVGYGITSSTSTDDNNDVGYRARYDGLPERRCL